MLGVNAAGIAQAYEVPTSGKLFLPMQQASGNVVDDFRATTIANGSGVTTDTNGTTGLWRNAGWLTTVELANQGGDVEIPASAIPWNMATGQSLLINVQVNRSSPKTGAINHRLMGHRQSPGTSFFLYTEPTTGDLGYVISDSNNVSIAPAVDASLNVADNANNIIQVLVDGAAKTLRIAMNGTNHAQANNRDISSLTGSTTPVNTWGFGTAGSGDNENVSMAFRYRWFQLHVFDTLPLNIEDILVELRNRPWHKLTAGDLA